MTGWTIDTLEKYFSAELESFKQLMDEREARGLERSASAKENISIAMTAAEKAIVKAEAAQEKRLESMNEFRGALTDQSSKMISRMEYDAGHKTLEEKMAGAIQRIIAIESGGKGKERGIGMIGGSVLGFLVGMAALAAVAAFFISIFHKV